MRVPRRLESRSSTRMSACSVVALAGNAAAAHLTAASKSNQPAFVSLLAVRSPRRKPTRRAGAVSPNMLAPGSYAKIVAFVDDPGSIATLNASALGWPHVNESLDVATATVPD